MHIDRAVFQGGDDEALKRVDFCLDQLERADRFKNKLDWGSDIVTHCTLEEIIGALIGAEQAIKNYIERDNKY